MVEIRTWHAHDAAQMIRLPDATSHKYTRGVLGLRTGSSAYPGAAVLGAEAAWRTGIGLVRFFPQLDDADPHAGLPSPAAAVLAARPETVFAEDHVADRARCDAWLVGSGTSPDTRSLAETHALLELLEGTAPVVADAGALPLLVSARITAPTLITPHLGELRSLASSCGLDGLSFEDERSRREAALTLASHLGVTVLLKGSVSVAASPTGLVLASGPATPWLATAGTGDVLAGILGALGASYAAAAPVDHDALARLGATAALIHDAAARIAMGPGAAHPITALDVAHHVARAIDSLNAEAH